MAVNVNAARDQANQITNQIAGLKRAKTQLTDYKSSLAANWSGAEVRYVSKGIDQVVRQIDDVINRLTSLQRHKIGGGGHREGRRCCGKSKGSENCQGQVRF